MNTASALNSCIHDAVAQLIRLNAGNMINSPSVILTDINRLHYCIYLQLRSEDYPLRFDIVVQKCANLNTALHQAAEKGEHVYVLRRYSPTKLVEGNPNKYESWWRGPYQVMSVIQKLVSDTLTKPKYTIRNLVTGKEYMADVTHLRPFCFDPNNVTPLNIAVTDADEHVVEKHPIKHGKPTKRLRMSRSLPPLLCTST